jgi:hypothetical protein
MAIKLDTIKDPKLRQRIMDAIQNAGILIAAIESDIPAKKKKRIRQDSKPLMNKLEQEYYDIVLACSTSPVAIQSIRFKLANGVWYKPDFFVPDGTAYETPLAIEVKGPHAFRGGFENLKLAAHQYPWIKWVLVWKDNGVWQEQTVLP